MHPTQLEVLIMLNLLYIGVSPPTPHADTH
jgi:hypothetical protein